MPEATQPNERSNGEPAVPRVVKPVPWEEEPMPPPLREAAQVVDEAFPWPRGAEEEEPMPTLPEEPETALPEESPLPEPEASETPTSTTISAPSWSTVETEAVATGPAQPALEAEAPAAPAEEAEQEVESLSPRRRLMTPTELARVTAGIEVTEVPEIFDRPEGPETLTPVPTDEEMRIRIAQQITAEDLSYLDAEISRLFRKVEERLSRVPELANRALQKLNEARTILLGDPGRFPEAEVRVEEVRVLLKQVESSERDAAIYARRFFAYNVAMLVLFLGLAVFDRAIATWLVSRGITPPFPLPLKTASGQEIPLTMAMYFAPWYCMIWGGIGGAIGSLYVLRTYVSRREFDREYNIHYWAHPIMGAVLGAIVYFLFVGGFFVVGAISQTETLPNPAQQVLTATSPLLILIALAFGLVQQEAYKMLYRILMAVTGSAKKEEHKA